MTRALFVLVALVFAPTQFRDEAEYRKEMREIDHAFTTLSEHREGPKGPELEREANRLAELFADVEAFWKERGDEEAAGYARMAKKGAEQASKAVRDDNEKAFEAAVELVAASCEACHREPLDKYRFPLPEQHEQLLPADLDGLGGETEREGREAEKPHDLPARR